MAQRVEVIYALPSEQWVVGVEYVSGLTARDAVLRSQLLERYPEIGLAPLVLGRFGVRIEPAALVQPGDRIEICRPLECDPRERRKQLSREGRVVGGR